MRIAEDSYQDAFLETLALWCKKFFSSCQFLSSDCALEIEGGQTVAFTAPFQGEKEIDMKSLFRICAMLALGLAASSTMLQAQEGSGLLGVWNITVKVVDCTTGAPIRTVHALQMYSLGGAFTETTGTASRGISEGVWSNSGGQTYTAHYWFYRYNPDGTFASFAQATNQVTLGDGGTFTAVGIIQDAWANGTNTIGCVTQTATRLANPNQQ